MDWLNPDGNCAVISWYNLNLNISSGGPEIQPNLIPGTINLEMVSKRITLPSVSMESKDLEGMSF